MPSEAPRSTRITGIAVETTRLSSTTMKSAIEVIAVIGGENEQPRPAPALPETAPHEFEREALAA